VLDDKASSEALNEMTFGLLLGIGAKVLTEFNATIGVQTQAYSTSLLTTLRKGLTKLEVAGYTAASLILHPTDWEATELALSSVNAVEHLSLPCMTRRPVGCSVCRW
jgi:hypothetical protein